MPLHTSASASYRFRLLSDDNRTSSVDVALLRCPIKVLLHQDFRERYPQYGSFRILESAPLDSIKPAPLSNL